MTIILKSPINLSSIIKWGVEMSLTNRRLELLKVLVNLSNQKGGPIHYTDVAEAMGISKWTAYDILKELEKLEFVKAEYYLDEDRSQGRSILMFIPTGKTYEFLNNTKQSDWDLIKNDLLNKLKENKANSIEEILNEMFHIKTPIKFCAYAITAFLLKLKLQGDSIIENIESSVSMSVNPYTALIFFVGAVLGILLYTKIKNDIDEKLVENVQRFHSNINYLSANDMFLLNSFLKESFSYV